MQRDIDNMEFVSYRIATRPKLNHTYSSHITSLGWPSSHQPCVPSLVNPVASTRIEKQEIGVKLSHELGARV